VVGKYTFIVEVEDTEYHVKKQFSFPLTIDCQVTVVSNESKLLASKTDFKYTLGAPAISFTIPSY
jgi:hypothetical protein